MAMTPARRINHSKPGGFSCYCLRNTHEHSVGSTNICQTHSTQKICSRFNWCNKFHLHSFNGARNFLLPHSFPPTFVFAGARCSSSSKKNNLESRQQNETIILHFHASENIAFSLVRRTIYYGITCSEAIYHSVKLTTKCMCVWVCFVHRGGPPPVGSFNDLSVNGKLSTTFPCNERLFPQLTHRNGILGPFIRPSSFICSTIA